MQQGNPGMDELKSTIRQLEGEIQRLERRAELAAAFTKRSRAVNIMFAYLLEKS